MSVKNLHREIIKINPEEFGDMTGYGPWNWDNQTYVFVEKINTSDKCDGECYDIIVQRESDLKYFKFDWWDSGNKYVFSEELIEVFPRQIIKIVYE